MKMKLLIVEDNPQMRQLIGSVVADLAEAIVECYDGEDAVAAYAAKNFSSDDRVLMDLQMPDVDGIEATKQIIAEHPPGRRPRIIALTANAFDEDREQCLRAGMDDYMSKPLKAETLEAALLRAERTGAAH